MMFQDGRLLLWDTRMSKPASLLGKTLELNFINNKILVNRDDKKSGPKRPGPKRLGPKCLENRAEMS